VDRFLKVGADLLEVGWPVVAFLLLAVIAFVVLAGAGTWWKRRHPWNIENEYSLTQMEEPTNYVGPPRAHGKVRMFDMIFRERVSATKNE